MSRRLVVCRLGAGCSVTAVLSGRSIDTTMGFTPPEELIMGRRSGSVDSGLLLDLLRRRDVAVDELKAALVERAGLLGPAALRAPGSAQRGHTGAVRAASGVSAWPLNDDRRCQTQVPSAVVAAYRHQLAGQWEPLATRWSCG
jgi:hypothetical protein